MNKFSFSCFFVLVAIAVTNAQRPENIVTESSETTDSSIFLDDIVSRRTILDQRVLPYESIREADIPWEKRIWEVIDVREKLNFPFVNKKEPLFQILYDAAASGSVASFAEDNFKKILQPSEIEGMMVQLDTVEVTDPVTFEVTRKPVRNEISADNIKFFRIKEIWFFDRESSRMKVRILGIAPIREREVAGRLEEQPMFWLYYPQLREVLAKHQAYNEFNDAAPLSWDDTFEMRRFSSYIYKESNAQDLRLKDIFPDNGVARLRESDKIKDKLFNFEHDLWEY